MTEYRDTADALSVLANETRLQIVAELADAAEPLSFTALRERVGVRDTGKFNYHLTELCEYFVRETRDGYELGHAGERLADDAGVWTGIERSGAPSADGESVGRTDTCRVCGDEDCGKLFHVHLTPPWR